MERSLWSVSGFSSHRLSHRRLRSVVVLAAALGLPSAGLAGCGADPNGLYEETDPGPVVGDLRFAHEGTLELKPSEQITIEMLAAPGSKVSVLLLGDPLDASLSQPNAQTDTDGVARVSLKAPSRPSTFRIRAQVDQAHAELAVSVSEFGFSTLRVVPEYSGQRQVDDWSASVSIGTSCQDVLNLVPDDPSGALTGSAPSGEAPSISSVPVGPKLVVAIRSGALVAGCSETTLSKPSELGEVRIDVLDRPLSLGEAEFDSELGFSPDQANYGSWLEAGAQLLAQTAFPESTPVAPLLLDTIEELLAQPQLSAFIQHRQQSQLDNTLGTWLLGQDPHAFCVGLGSVGQNDALLAAKESSSKLSVKLLGRPNQIEKVSFLLMDWNGASSESLGLSEFDFTWAAQPGDKLSLSGTLPLSSARLAAHWMKLASASQYAPAQSPSEALATQLDCDTIGTLVGGFNGCDASCGKSLCESAIDQRWQMGVVAADQNPGSLSISLSATVSLDKTVVPVAFSGSWVGTLGSPGQTGAVGGTAEGAAPPPR